MSGKKQILIIEDDVDIATMLSLNLCLEGFEVGIEHSGEAGLARLQRERADVVILDLILPGMDGLRVCRKLRESAEYVAIIILSAKSSETQRVLGLELGADDYLVKPFSMAELIARVHAVMRRMDAIEQMTEARSGVIRCGILCIDPIAREVRMGELKLSLTTKEFDLLVFFARNSGRVFNRLELLDHVWGYTHDGYEHTVNSHINRLRAKIESNPAKPEYILTVWGIGYKFSTEPISTSAIATASGRS